MAYLPAVCEPWQNHNVRPGWICCGCGHFNRKSYAACKICKHDCCSVADLPPIVKIDQRKRAMNRVLVNLQPKKKKAAVL